MRLHSFNNVVNFDMLWDAIGDLLRTSLLLVLQYISHVGVVSDTLIHNVISYLPWGIVCACRFFLVLHLFHMASPVFYFYLVSLCFWRRGGPSPVFFFFAQCGFVGGEMSSSVLLFLLKYGFDGGNGLRWTVSWAYFDFDGGIMPSLVFLLP